MKKEIKRTVAAGAVMGLMSSLVFTGCSKKDNTTGTTTVLDPNGESYVADFYDVTDENGKKGSVNKIYYEGDKLYVSANVEENEYYKGFIVCFNADDMQEDGRISYSFDVEQAINSLSDLPENIGDYETGMSTNGVVFTEEGIKIYAEWYAYNYGNIDPDDMVYIDDDEEREASLEDIENISKNFVIDYDYNYNFKGIEEIVYDFLPEEEYLQSVINDGQGHTAFIASHTVYFTDIDGNVLQSIKITDNWIDSYFLGQNGEIYVIYYTDDWSMTCGKVSANSPSVMEGIDVKDTYSNGFFLSDKDNNTFYYYNSEKLFSRDLTSGETTDVLKWLDIDIDGSGVYNLYEGNDGAFYANVIDFTVYESQIVKIHKVSNAEITVKTEIRVASLYNYNSTMESAIVAYNKSQDQYKVVADYYYDWEKDGDSVDDAITNLNNDILSSSAPDIVCLEGLELRGLVNKGALEDLSGYIANSSSVNIEDYNKTVINAYTIDGKIISIPRSFNLMTIIVNPADFPSGKNGWTLSEMIDYINAHPGSELEAYMLRGEFIDTYIGYNLDEYIDWNTGSVDFNKDSFRKALEYAATMPEEIDWNNVDYNFNFSEALSEGKILAMRSYLTEAQDIQMYNAYFKQGTKYIGMPNASGENTQIMTTDTGYAIVSNSANKEAAWDFYEFYLNRERSSWDYALPSKNSELQAVFDKELEHAGEPSGSMMSDGSGWEYEFHYSTQEEIDQIKALIDAAVAVNTDPEIMSIIEEEAGGYFSGQKSLDDVIGLIQSRVQIYVSERVQITDNHDAIWCLSAVMIY